MFCFNLARQERQSVWSKSVDGGGEYCHHSFSVEVCDELYDIYELDMIQILSAAKWVHR